VWDFVEEVTCIGEEETIGIETGNHTICVEDFGTHNTTFNSEAHTVQWIINYPDIGLAIFQYSLSKAEAILASIKHHFCFNGKFRALFPELCPPVEKIYDFGTKAEFTTPGRSLKRSRREPTVITASIESGLAGYHFEVIKFSDVVEPKNTENIDQCLKTIKQFELSKPLLNSPKYWIDVEGTRYHFADLYGKILEQWEQERHAGEETEWNIYLRGCLKRDVPEGKYTFTPDDYKYPHLKDQDGNRISWFPKNYPLKALETIEKYEPEVFASQYENHPIGGRGGIPDFPIIEKDGKYERPAIISLSDYDRVLKARKILSVDLAETVGEKSNYTVFVFATLDRHGRTYVEGIVREKYTPDQSTDALIAACNIFKPDELLIEEVNFTRGFMVGLRRQWDLNKHYFRPTIRMYKRDNIKTKEERIRLSLQYSYKNGDLRFVRDKISKKSWDALIGELYEFPKGKTDDILDALTDLFSERSWFGQEWAKAKPIPELSFKGPSEAVQRAAFMAAAGIDEPRWDEGTANYINILTPDSIHSAYRKRR